MEEKKDLSDQLLIRLDILSERQKALSEEIIKLREEVSFLKTNPSKETVTEILLQTEDKSGSGFHSGEDELKNPVSALSNDHNQEKNNQKADKQIVNKSRAASGIEKYIGENLINKIGIIITVIGVAIGAKYAIDHQLINPLWRIISGYLFGIGMLTLALRLKGGYMNFSAVLLSGSMAILYFMTYAAFSFYDLIGQVPAFALMVLFTSFTVAAAINYDRQVIAHIGLVGAYAVPFVLGRWSDNVTVLFTYTAIINIGILFISFKKYWKPLWYTSFIITWIMFLVWFVPKFDIDINISLSAVFLSIFFATFYVIFLSFKLIKKEKFDFFDVLLLLVNSFIFYGAGYQIVTSIDGGENFAGIYTVANAFLHFIVSIIIFRRRLSDRNLFLLVAGLSLIFIAISIPVQLNGSWVTLLWAGEAAILFWIGRTRGVGFYEVLSYLIIYLTFFSFIHDLSPLSSFNDSETNAERIIPVLNVKFLSSFLTVCFLGFISFIENRKDYKASFNLSGELKRMISFSIASVFLITLYYVFRNEISVYFDRLFDSSIIEISKNDGLLTEKIWNEDISNFKKIWIINYSLLFLTLLSVFNIRLLHNRTLGLFNLVLNVLVILIFLIQGLYVFSELRETLLQNSYSEYYLHTGFSIGIRYISFVFAGFALVSTGLYMRQGFLKPLRINLIVVFDVLLGTALIWVISSELISVMALMKYAGMYKLGLSILWGVCSLFLIVFGIWKKKTHLRISAFFLFGATLLKLFFYDLSDLNTISRTIIFVTLGILLLIISFLYNKYRNIISGGLEE